MSEMKKKPIKRARKREVSRRSNHESVVLDAVFSQRKNADIERLAAEIAALTDSQRRDLFREYCPKCGSKEQCYCDAGEDE